MGTLRNILLICLLISNVCSAQQKDKDIADSLVKVASMTKDDTNKVNLLNELSTINYNINPDMGIKYGEEALSLAEKLNWPSGIAKSYITIGGNHRIKGNYPVAYDYFNKALQKFESLKDQTGIARSLSNIGLVYANQSNYIKALEYDIKALDLFESIQNKIGTATTLSNIGIIYYDKSDYEKSMEYDLKALKIYESLGDRSGMAASYVSIGVSYNSLAKYSEALHYLNKALVINESIGDQYSIANNLSNIGVVYLNLQDYTQAMEYYFKVQKIYEQMGNKRELASILGNIGSAYYSVVTNNNEIAMQKLFGGNKSIAIQKAKSYTTDAIQTFEEIGDLNSLVYYYKLMSDMESYTGNCKDAFMHYKRYNFLRDSVFSMHEQKKLTETAMQYEFAKKEAISKAEQERKDLIQKIIIFSILIGLILASAFAFVVYRQRNKVNEEKKRSDALLLNILPEEVADELKRNGIAHAKQYNNVTVLFTDFVNFTGISSQMTPKELVAEIHQNFSAFDAIIEKHGLEKIKTIGDAYMAVCGLPNETPDHAKRVVRAAIEIRDYIIHNNGKYQVRIGANSGPVVAGIVGVKKYAYDIWGDTVNTAHRMESNGEIGKINISANTYELIKDDFECTLRDKFEVKGKGEIDMYFVEYKTKG